MRKRNVSQAAIKNATNLLYDLDPLLYYQMQRIAELSNLVDNVVSFQKSTTTPTSSTQLSEARQRFVTNFSWTIPTTPNVLHLADNFFVSQSKAFPSFSCDSLKAQLRMQMLAPNQISLDELRKFMLLEVFAGTGLWAKLLQLAGIPVIATDTKPRGPKYKAPWFTQVHAYDAIEAVEVFKPWHLMISWPPYDSPTATLALKKFIRINTSEARYSSPMPGSLIYIGENYGGCCANDEFFSLIAQNFTKVVVLFPPQWLSIHDQIFYFQLKR